MRLIPTIAATVGIISASTPLHARDALLQPSSPWNIHYADDSCRLLRVFGKGDEQVTLILDQFEPGDEFRLTFAGEPVNRSSSAGSFDVELRFGPNEAEMESSALTGTMGEEPALFINGDQRIAPFSEAEEKMLAEEARRLGHPAEVPLIGEEREAAASWLALTNWGRGDIVLETGPMDEPLAALRRCSWDTVRMWGLDVEQQKALTRKAFPKGRSSRWFDADDYPKEMILRGHQGIVNFRLMIDETGKPTACHIQTSTRPKEFDDVVCRSVMKRARFEPALDAQGQPVPSYWRESVRFEICC